MITNIIITVDVECSLPGDVRGGAVLIPVGVERRVYCKNGNDSYGIDLIMQTLNDYNMKGVFFCDSCMKYLTTEEESAKVLTDIYNNGHDVQLHIHPIFKLWKTKGLDGKLLPDNWSDNINKLPIDVEDEYIKEGVEFITRYTHKTPIAFRAGNYGASDRTLSALKRHGLIYDSSYNMWARVQKRYNNQNITTDITNRHFIINDIIELPVTNYLAGVKSDYRFFAPEGSSSLEMITALDRLYNINMEYVVIVLHSFSFAKNTKDTIKNVKFNSIAFKRFIKTLDFISRQKDKYRVTTFSELNSEKVRATANAKSGGFVSIPVAYSIGRYIGQFQQKLL